jgi:hypothetical protein
MDVAWIRSESCLSSSQSRVGCSLLARTNFYDKQHEADKIARILAEDFSLILVTELSQITFQCLNCLLIGAC